MHVCARVNKGETVKNQGKNKSIDETEECTPKMHSSGRVMLVKE